MSIAQALYEGMPVKGQGSIGLITYMRTDSTHLFARGGHIGQGLYPPQLRPRLCPGQCECVLVVQQVGPGGA